MKMKFVLLSVVLSLGSVGMRPDSNSTQWKIQESGPITLTTPELGTPTAQAKEDVSTVTELRDLRINPGKR
jgi:hypothetical protein